MRESARLDGNIEKATTLHAKRWRRSHAGSPHRASAGPSAAANAANAGAAAGTNDRGRIDPRAGPRVRLRRHEKYPRCAPVQCAPPQQKTPRIAAGRSHLRRWGRRAAD